MARKLEEKEEDWQNLEERFSSQQEEIEDKNRKLKKLFVKFTAAQTEIKDLQKEFQVEREDMADTIRILTQELRLKSFVCDQFIPGDEMAFIEDKAIWNDESDLWDIPKLEMAGNNIRRPNANIREVKGGKVEETKDEGMLNAEAVNSVYFVYTEEGAVREDALGRQPKKKRAQSARRPGTATRKKKQAFQEELEAQKPQQEMFPKARGLVSK